MIETVTGSILHSEMEAIVNPVNCVGVMGRGLALQFRTAFPSNYRYYRRSCERGRLQPGMILIFEQNPYARPRYIVNFSTKVHWRDGSRLEYIDSGLEALIAEVRRLGISSIAIPPLGCGLGGLDWMDVKPRIETIFAPLPDVRVQLYETF